jgi:hypothetical protein
MMQIDSASDVSLIPESLTRQLGLIAREEEDCEVQAYDGTRSVARSVECELIFLRRAFAGTYLVMEGPIGILGRDILNYVSLVLDGPRLEWKEEHSAE